MSGCEELDLAKIKKRVVSNNHDDDTVYEMCLRDRSIDHLCTKHVSGIGVLIVCV